MQIDGAGRLDDRHARHPAGGPVTKLAAPPVSRAAVRWSLGHALPRTLLRRAAKQGDLHGRMFVATPVRATLAALEPVLDELRAHGPFYRGKYASVSADNAAVRALLSSPDAGSGVRARRTGDSRLARLQAWAMAGRSARPADAAVAAGHRAAGPHPLPQARLPGLQRPRGRAAARPDPADRRRAARPARPDATRSTSSRRTAACCRSPSSPRSSASPSATARRCCGSAPRPRRASTSGCPGGSSATVEAALREFDAWLAPAPRQPAPPPGRRPAQPARRRAGGRRRASPTPSSSPPPGWCSRPASRPP